ncbi:MAG TPA: hypothetical protein VJN88_10835, partial [Ktedonobacterales bacterium]|nr:hypothetical protein [Ktedonobacterales bacterium]
MAKYQAWGRGVRARLARLGGQRLPRDGAELTPKKVLTAFTSLPRVLRLVWNVNPVFTLLLAALYVLQG